MAGIGCGFWWPVSSGAWRLVFLLVLVYMPVLRNGTVSNAMIMKLRVGQYASGWPIGLLSGREF